MQSFKTSSLKAIFKGAFSGLAIFLACNYLFTHSFVFHSPLSITKKVNYTPVTIFRDIKCDLDGEKGSPEYNSTHILPRFYIGQHVRVVNRDDLNHGKTGIVTDYSWENRNFGEVELTADKSFICFSFNTFDQTNVRMFHESELELIP